jgi:hypothetical protein
VIQHANKILDYWITIIQYFFSHWAKSISILISHLNDADMQAEFWGNRGQRPQATHDQSML